MARHGSFPTPTAQRALVAVATAGMALGAGAATAAADAGLTEVPHTSLNSVDPSAGLRGATGAVRHTTGTVSGLKPNPLAGTGVDPLSNSVETEVSDFNPASSRTVTGPVDESPSIGAMPVAGRATGLMGAQQGSGNR